MYGKVGSNLSVHSRMDQWIISVVNEDMYNMIHNQYYFLFIYLINKHFDPRINFSPIPYANSTHATSVAATKEIFDLCSPESTAREENTNASPDLTVLNAALQLAVCKREEAELMLTLAQAKANTGPNKKRADDNHVTSGRVPLSNMNNGGELKLVKVEKEVKVKIEEEWTP